MFDLIVVSCMQVVLDQFNVVLEVGDVQVVVSLFVIDSYWCDLVVVSWNLKIVEGLVGVVDMLGQ